jgi:hypothetical protein
MRTALRRSLARGEALRNLRCALDSPCDAVGMVTGAGTGQQGISIGVFESPITEDLDLAAVTETRRSEASAADDELDACLDLQ